MKVFQVLENDDIRSDGGINEMMKRYNSLAHEAEIIMDIFLNLDERALLKVGYKNVNLLKPESDCRFKWFDECGTKTSVFLYDVSNETIKTRAKKLVKTMNYIFNEQTRLLDKHKKILDKQLERNNYGFDA